MDVEPTKPNQSIWTKEFEPWKTHRRSWIRVYYIVLSLILAFSAGMQLFVFWRGWPMRAASALGLPDYVSIAMAMFGAISIALSAWTVFRMPSMVGYRQSANLALMSSVQASFLVLLYCLPIVHTKGDPGSLLGWKLLAFLNVIGLVLVVVTVIGYIRNTKVSYEA